MPEPLITELWIDASQATAGANVYDQAATRIQQSSERATVAVDKLGVAIDATGERMRRAGGQVSGASPFDQHIVSAEAYRKTLENIGALHDDRMRKTQQSGTFGPAAMQQLSYAGQFQQSLAGPAAAFAAPLTADARAAAEVSAATVVPLVAAGTVDKLIDSVHPGAPVNKLARTMAQAANDPTVVRETAKSHAAEAAVAPEFAQTASRVVGPAVVEEAALPSAVQSMIARLQQPEGATGDGIERELDATRAASARTTQAIAADMETAFNPPSLGTFGSRAKEQFDIAERATYGATTAIKPAFATDARLALLGNDYVRTLKKSDEPGADVLAAKVTAATTAATKAPATGLSALAATPPINVGAFRKPINEVDAEAWNKDRDAAKSYSTILSELFTRVRSGNPAVKEAAAAADELGNAHGRAAGGSNKIREGLILFHELLRGDFKRFVGSATIELQNFGALGYIFNPITLGITAVAGAMAYLAYKSSEIEANLRSFGATVKVMGDGSLTSAAELERFTEELKHTGVAGDDAKKTIQEIERSGFIRPGQSTRDFAALARDISQYNGTGAAGTPAAAEGLLKAFSGDVDAALKFAESLHALSAPQIAAIHDLDQHTRSAEAFGKIYDAIRAKIQPFTGDLSELQKAFLGISTAWDEFTTSLAKSDVPSLVTSLIKTALDNVREDIREIDELAKFVGRLKGLISGVPQVGPGSGNTEPYAAAPIPPRTATTPTQQQVGHYLTGDLGFTPSQSAAVIGQARQESSFNPASGLGTAHQGMFQWDSNRWGQLQAWAQLNSLDPMDYRTQLQFAKKEIQTKAPEFFSASSLGEQTSILTKKFEGPGNYATEIPTRLRFAEQALGTTTTPFRPTEQQTAAIDLQNQKLKEQLGISSQIAGVDREAVQERVRLQQEAAKNPLIDQNKFIDEGMIGFFKNRQALFESQHRLNDQEISDTEKIARAYQRSAVEGLRAETLIQAQQQIRERGGSPAEVPIAQRDIINQRAAAAISASRQQSTLADPAIAAAEGLARASYVSRAEEEKTKIANEAAAQTQNVLNLALLQGSDAYIKEATAIDENARAQFRRRDAAAQGLEAGHQLQANKDQSQVLDLASSLQGQGSDAIRTQVDLLRARQDIELRYTALTQGERDAIFASTAGIIQQNAALTQARESTARINDAFRSIASTIDTDLSNSIRNALVRTPLEAGQHLKHYWDEFRAGLKQVAGEMLSTFAQLAFIKPLTGTIAGALGLGQTAQSLGTFGGLFTGGAGGEQKQGFATGGAMTVGGSGATDSTHVQFMATAGERVVVMTPAQHAAAKEHLPHFAGGGELDPASGDVGYYGGDQSETPTQAAEAITAHLRGEDRDWNQIMTAMPSQGFAMREEETDYTKGGSPPSYKNYQHWWNYATAAPKAFSDVFGNRLDQTANEIGSKAYQEPFAVTDPAAIKPARPRQTMAWIEDPYASNSSDLSQAATGSLPQFATGGELDPATGQTIYYNDAGQPFTLPEQQGPPAPTQDYPAPLQSLVDLSRAGLKSESAFLSTAAADKPLLGLDAGTGELTGRIPALAEFMQQGLAGGAPAGTLSAGMKLGGEAATAAADVAAAEKPAAITAYHGSPHDFEKFDATKIGTGEGAQAYGHGLYFAENPAVAEGYQTAGTHSSRIQYRGGGLSNIHPDDMAGMQPITRQAVEWLKSYSDIPKAIGDAAYSDIPGLPQEIQRLESAGDLTLLPRGHGYEVGIHADPESFLHWDKPLSEQPQSVQQAVASIDNPVVQAWTTNGAFPHVHGSSVYQALSGHGGMAAGNAGGRAGASETLRDAGITGIRYLDQGSRAGGEGTSNYVMFGDENIEILRKYGLAGPPSLAQPGDQPAPTEPAAGGSFNAGLPMLATGGTVDQTGAAIVHAGETIFSSGQTENALSSLTHGLQGLSTVVGQATPGLQSLSHAATELGAVSSIWKAGTSLLGGGGGETPAQGIRDSQLAMNVSGIGSGGSVFGATSGGNVIGSGALVTVNGLNQAGTGTGQAAPTTDGISEQQFSDLLKAGATPTGTGTQTNAAPLLESFIGTITSAAPGEAQPSAASTAAAGSSTFVVPAALGGGEVTGGAVSLAPILPATPEAALPTGVPTQTAAPATGAAATSGLVNPSNISGAVSGANSLSSFLSQPGLLPSWLSNTGSGGIFGTGGITATINNFGTNLGFSSGIGAPIGGVAGAPFSATVAGPSVPSALAGAGGIFGATTLTSALSGAGAGFGAGSLLNSVLGGNKLGGTIGSAGGAITGAIIGSIFPGIGTLIGGIVGGLAGGGLGGLFGSGPAGQSAGVTIGAGGAQTFEQAGGSAANIQASNQVAGQISGFVQALGQLTDAQGKAIGTIDSGLIAVNSDNRQGITVSGGNISGGQFGQNAQNAVTQTELQIINSLTNVSSTLDTVRKHITDPSQIQAAVQFIDVYDKLNVTSAQLTASLTGNVNAIGPFSSALLTINQTFTQLTAQAKQFGVDVSPITAALAAVSDKLRTDFKLSLDEALSTALSGGNDFLAKMLAIHQSFQQATNDATALASGVPTGTTPGAASGSASTPSGPILVGEQGPEWMRPRGGDWTLVGRSGPEIIDQPGGATILPYPQTPAGRAFASGTADTHTIGVGDIAGQIPGIGSAISEASGGPSLLGAAGSAFGISSEVISSIGSVLQGVPIVGGVLSLATGGNPISAGIGIATSLLALGLANPVIGLIGGLVALAANLFGPKPSNNASGDLVDLATGAITGFQSAGDKKADQTVEAISAGISAITTTFQAATGGSISGAVSVQDGRRDGIKTSYSGPLGHVDAKWGSVSDAIGQFGLAIAHDLTGIDPALQAQLDGINDPNALIPAIETFTGKSIDLLTGTVTDAASAAPATAAAPPPPPPQLYSISQASGPNYVGVLNAADAAWWRAAGATLTPSADGAVAAPRANATVYKISQVSGANYVGDLTAADVQWWQNAGATVTPYGSLLTSRPGAAEFAITQTEGPSYVGDLKPADVAWWQNAGATVRPSDGTMPTPRTGAALYEIDQSEGPSYVGDLKPDDVTWWIDAGAKVTPFAVTAATVPVIATAASVVAPGATGYAAGTPGTPPGPILVGEAGPEWMRPAAGKWTQVGVHGPEVLDQPGGAIVLPYPQIPASHRFAAGTDAITVPQALLGTDAYPYSSDLNSYVNAFGTPVVGDNTAAAASVTTAPAAAAPAATPAAAPAATPAATPAASSSDGTIAGTPLAQINATIAGTETAQAGPILAGLGIDQLTTVIQDLGTTAPEIAAMAQALISSGNALPDIVTQALQALTDPLDIAIEKEKAAGQERIAIATQTGQDLVKVQQLNSANLVQAVISNLGNQNALNAILYPGNTKALEALQAAPTLAGLSGQQLTALATDIGNVAPDLAAFAQQFIDAGTALPDTITQALEGIVNPLKLAIQQQAAQATGRTEVQQATGQSAGAVAALNTASLVQAITQQISNPQALLALTANGSPQGLAALQAGPTIAGLGADQLNAVLKAIGTAAPDISNMISTLIASGNALPDALKQASESITQAGLLAVQKAQALGFEQLQTAAAAGQNVGEAQTLAASEVAGAVAQATSTQVPINGLPDWISQIEEAATAPLQLAIQKEQAAGAQRVQIAEATGADLVRIQQANAEAIAQLWYQATAQLTSLKQQITGGTLSGLTPANQVLASVEQFNQILKLVQGGNTNFINDLATTGQAAVQAAQTAYGNGPQTATVREQVLAAIQPFLVSASGFPTSGATAIGAAATATGATSDLKANTSALQDLTTAITTTLGGSALTTGSGGGGAPLVSAAGAPAAVPPPAAGASAANSGGPNASDLATTLGAPAGVPLYNITQPGGGPSYVGDLTPPNVAWWQNAGATVSPYSGTLPTPGAGESLYQITQPGGGPSYIGSLNATNLAWWQNTGATVTPYTAPAAAPAAATAAASTASSAAASTSAPATAGLTTNPVTGVPFAGGGITAVTPNFPIYPSASTLSNALADAIAGNATASDWASINQALQAGILDPTKQPGYALVIEQAQQWAAGQAIDPSAGLAQALSDAVNGTPTLQEWALINQAVNAGILDPTTQPQYSTIIQRARAIANAQATSLSSIPNNQTAYFTAINGLPAFAAGSASTPPGLIMVGERGPEWIRPANDNMPWSQVGIPGAQIIDQPGGATILPFPKSPMDIPAFATGTAPSPGFYLPPPSQGGDGSNNDAVIAELRNLVRSSAEDNEQLRAEMVALRKQLQGGQINADQNAQTQHALTRQTNESVGPNISAPARRLVG